ncbi:hypothetical protein ACFL4L_02690 [bacterium]
MEIDHDCFFGGADKPGECGEEGGPPGGRSDGKARRAEKVINV